MEILKLFARNGNREVRKHFSRFAGSQGKGIVRSQPRFYYGQDKIVLTGSNENTLTFELRFLLVRY